MKSIHQLMSLKGRVALITGGAGHIGMALCETLAELGASIVVLDVKESACRKAAARLNRKFGVRTLPLTIDLGNERALRTVPGLLKQKMGRLDILIHCAALGGTSPLEGWIVPLKKQSPSTWRKALEVNLTSAFVLIQSCSSLLARSGRGSIINVSSIYGLVGPDMKLYAGLPMGNPAAYAASKGGLIQLTRWLATVLAPGIRVNAITPGGVLRNQPAKFRQRYVAKVPLRRMATEEDLKGAVAFLASDLSSYVTGQNLVVDGGFTVW